jgi:hypothetical protein
MPNFLTLSAGAPFSSSRFLRLSQSLTLQLSLLPWLSALAATTFFSSAQAMSAFFPCNVTVKCVLDYCWAMILQQDVFMVQPAIIMQLDMLMTQLQQKRKVEPGERL